MGHPNRKTLREKKKSAKRAMLNRKNAFDVLDLTPYNAIGRMRGLRFEIKLK